MKIKMLLATVAASVVCLAAQAQSHFATVTQTSMTPTSATATITCESSFFSQLFNFSCYCEVAGTDWTTITFTFWEGTVVTMRPGDKPVNFYRDRNTEHPQILARTPSTNIVKIQVNGGTPTAKRSGGRLMINSIDLDYPHDGAYVQYSGTHNIQTTYF